MPFFNGMTKRCHTGEGRYPFFCFVMSKRQRCVEKPPMFGAVQKCSDARRVKTELRGVYGYTLSGAVRSATQQTMCPSGYERFVKPSAFSGKVDYQF
jgi:hypothetical protein